MRELDRAAKARIISAALAILSEADNIDKITVRQIAAHAQVGVGLINYHFKTKENLLCAAIGTQMSQTVEAIVARDSSDPATETTLRDMLKALCEFGAQNERLLGFMLRQALESGDLSAQLSLIPLLRDICGGQMDEMQLRVLAMQIVSPIQAAALSPEAFRMYSGVNLFDKRQRDAFIDTLTGHVLPKGEREV